MIKTICDNCSAEIEKTNWEFNRCNNHFCCKECRYEYQRKFVIGENHPSWKGGLVKLECANCGVEIERKKCAIHEGKVNVCGSQCRGEWISNNLKGENHPIFNKEEYACDYCGNIIMLNQQKLHDDRSHFCCRECFGKWHSETHRGENHTGWKGTTPFIKAVRLCREYYDWRTACFERDKFTCQSCGQIGYNLVVHHKKPLIEIVNDNNLENMEEAKHCQELWNIDNGITLCTECHKLEHSSRNKLK